MPYIGNATARFWLFLLSIVLEIIDKVVISMFLAYGSEF